MNQPEKSGTPRTTTDQVPDELARKDQEIRTGQGGLGGVGSPIGAVGRPGLGSATGSPLAEGSGRPLASGNEVHANLPDTGQLAGHPQAQQPQQPGGGGAPTTGAAGSDAATASEEARNQEATSSQSRASSGTTAPSRLEG